MAAPCDRSDVACLHTEGCPLFPLLNASLRSWRDYYCDTDGGWRGCARYQVALAGGPVPITLLPNGAHAQHLSDPPVSGPPATARRAAGPPATEPAGQRRRWWRRLSDWISRSP